MAYILHKYSELQCDEPDCTAAIYGDSEPDVHDGARVSGWTTHRGVGRYCLEHHKQTRCEDCDRFMFPKRRQASDFPQRWARKEKATQCQGCWNGRRTGALGEQWNQLNKAAEQYEASRSEVYRHFVESTKDEDQDVMAFQLLEDMDATDVVPLLIHKVNS